MYVLDTNHLTLLERGNADALTLEIRLEKVPPGQVVTTIVNYEEQMRGWLEVAAKATTRERLLFSYQRLQVHIDTFNGVPLLPFNEAAVNCLEDLRKAKVNIGTMDLKIAAICLAHDATLLTRNSSDFGKVPGLKAEDWSV